jgi:hypothetical protein
MKTIPLCAVLLAWPFSLLPSGIAAQTPKPAEIKEIKSYRLDFNWAATGRRRFGLRGTRDGS